MIEYIILAFLVIGCAVIVAAMGYLVMWQRRVERSYETPGKDQQEEWH